MRITTSSIIFLLIVFFQTSLATAQEERSYLPSPFDELMQTLSSSGVVEGLIYADFNGNGTRDSGEPGLEGVRVIIVNANGNGQTTPTDSDGIWSAQVVEGTATLIMDATSLDAGFLQTEGTDPSTVLVIANDTVQAETKGFAFQGDATGHLYFDTNGNGVQDSLELDMPDVDVLVTDQYGNNQTVTTDSEGDWQATVLFGPVEVNIDESDADFPTGAFQTEGTNPSTHTIPNGEVTFTENDGFFESGILSGIVYFDDNGSGNQDPGEPGIANIPVEVTTSQGDTINLVTDGNGAWSTRVPEGTTVSLIDETAAGFPIGATQTDGTNPTTTEVVNGQTYEEFDGYLGSGILRGHLYFDENGNGTQDVGEADMPDVDVEIIDSFGNVTILETDINGDWEIEVPAGNTFSNIDQQDPDFPQGAVQTEGTDPTLTLVVAGSDTLSDNDGFFEVDPELEGTLLGHLYIDTNGNGTQDSGEPDLPNIDVQITDTFGNVTILETDANGDWSIEVPSGNTTSDILQSDPDFPVGAVQTEGTDPTTTFVPADTTILSDNDGFFLNDPSLVGVLEGHLYFDTNGNGTQDIGEPDMPNVDVEIIDVFGDVTLLETDVNGDWSIEVPAGNTFSNIDQQDPDFPTGAIQTEGTDPSLTFVVADETTLSDLDGFFVPDPSLEGTLLGHLYFDTNGNGIQEIGEPDMPNVDVEIIDVFNNVTILTTDANGDWSITVPAGDTFSNIDQQDPDFPAGAIQTEGTDPTLTFVPQDETVLSDNDGFFISDPELLGTLTGHLYIDTNGNGNQDTGEPDLNDVEVTITDVFGDTSSVVTNANGNWSIEVPAGNTISDINQQDSNFPAGAVQTEGTDPTTTFVTVGNTTFSEDDGFFIPDPSLTGTLTGHLYFDDNGNGTQDVGEPDMPDVDVEIIDVFNNVTLLTTDVNGDWSIEVPAGNTFSNIDQQDPDFPQGAVQTEGTDPTLTFVVGNATTQSDNDGFFVQDPSITGLLSGHLYFDNNNNGIQDNDEPDMPNVLVQVVDGDNITQNLITDANGDWTAQVAEGSVTSTIDVNDPNFPEGATQTQGDNPTTTEVNAGDELSEEPDGFFTENQSGILSGILYLDENNNSTQDPGEPGIANIEVEIEESDGSIQTLTTDENGQWFASVTIGSTTSFINENDPNFPEGAVQTQGTNPTTIFIGSNANGFDVDGFFVEETTGNLTGKLYYDDNGNGTQDADEDGISNVRIFITDAAGTELQTETNIDGDWSIEVLAGETVSKIDTNDNDFPTNVTQTEGSDPTTTLVVTGESTNSDVDGFFIDDIQIFNAVGSEGNQLNRFFIRGIENYPNNSVQIFNRQGVKVYDAEGYDNGSVRFDGFSDGNITIQKDKRLPPGTYFYILNYVNRIGEAMRRNGYLHLN
ncbi:SdrD B-like domain-containing protein [Psychroflexus montanilacus]|uniref:SdrD B-like domain-containing protein n=1 Tax=Psychroflexus montanilacus TaxID=2873598 RepID=UPI001CCDF4C5|nr:SdrD B-like domain-containing protein [Psychroflexus montanilacus]MBZ9651732.1 gliding motility-associated C-terminal domain-containing protein [Psychroflexus montanilacus]